MISKEALKAIAEIVSKYQSAITVRYTGPDAVSAEELSRLIREGILDQKDVGGSAIEDAWLIGRIREIAPEKELEKMTPEEFRNRFRGLLSSLSDEQRKKLDLIKESARTQLIGLGDHVQAKIRGTLLNISFDHANEYLGEPVKNILEEAYIQDSSLAKLVTNLRQNAGDFSAKWTTIATTEYSRAINVGACDLMIEKNKDKTPEDIYCYFLVVNDSKLCRHCHDKYLNSNGTPRVFKMSELISNGSNYGKKAAAWKASIGGMHPNCRCVVSEIPENWGFVAGSSQLTFKKMGHNEYLKQKTKNK